MYRFLTTEHKYTWCIYETVYNHSTNVTRMKVTRASRPNGDDSHEGYAEGQQQHLPLGLDVLAAVVPWQISSGNGHLDDLARG